MKRKLLHQVTVGMVGTDAGSRRRSIGAAIERLLDEMPDEQITEDTCIEVAMGTFTVVAQAIA